MELLRIFVIYASLAHGVSAVRTSRTHSCFPSSTVYSSSTIVKTPDAVTTTVQTTATYYTKVIKYRAARTITVITNVTGTLSSTCWPSTVSLVKRRELDDITSEDFSPSAVSSTAQFALFPNTTSLPTVSLATAPVSTSTVQSSTLVQAPLIVTPIFHATQISNQSSSVAHENVTKTVTTTAVEQTLLTAKPIATTPNLRTAKPITTATKLRVEHTKVRTTPTRMETDASHSVMPISKPPSTSRRTHVRGSTIVETLRSTCTTDTIQKIRNKTTKRASKSSYLSTNFRTKTHRTGTTSVPPTKSAPTRTSGGKKWSCATVTTLVALTTVTAPTPTFTKRATHTKISTSITRVKKVGSSTTITRSRTTAIVATATILGGRTGKFTDLHSGKAVFNVYNRTDFPNGNLATCDCVHGATCSLSGRNLTCADFQGCMSLCATYNMKPDGPACMGVSFSRPIARIGEEALIPTCSLKWIVPPHTLPQDHQQCGIISGSVDSAVLYRQAFY